MIFQLTNILGWQRTQSSDGSDGSVAGRSRERSNLRKGAIKRSSSFDGLPRVDPVEDGARSCPHVLFVV